MTKTSLKTTVEWKNLNWRKLEKAVSKLQKRIYRASQRGDVRVVRKLQKMLMRSWSARCIAVRKVTQDNKGKNTAGIDGMKSLNSQERLIVTENLKIDRKSSPLRRVWTPKLGKKEKRASCLPTIKDRIKQAIAKIALEPEWEAKFEESSYGFRPGRSAHDAIEHIFIGINQCQKYVLDADIAKCFDKINHSELLRKINTFPKMRKQIKAWLKAGILDDQELVPTDEGTPPWVIAPLLANIALHGMINDIQSQYNSTKRISGKSHSWKPIIIRYADDFVVFHIDKNVIHEIQNKISEWLKPLGLTLQDEKTKICHTFHKTEDKEPGFDFLGFNVRQFKDNRARLGYKTIIKPSKKSVQRHVQQLRTVLQTHKNAKVADIIKKLNPIIRGWSNYYRTVCSAETFKSVHHNLYMMLTQWGRRRTKNYKTTYQKYWKEIDGVMTFSSDAPKGGEPMVLKSHNQFRIKRHTKVKGEKSPYDSDWAYWCERLVKTPGLSTRMQKLLKKQKGSCGICGLKFSSEDKLEIDHIIPKIDGGNNTYKNLQLLHRHCHDNKTGKENQERYAKTRCSQITEEPYEVKVSSTVLNQR